MAFVRTLKKHLRPQIKVIELDNHINDPIFAETVVPILIEMIQESSEEKA